MRLKEDLSDSVRFAGLLDLSDSSDLSISEFQKTMRDGMTDGRNHGWTDPHIEMLGRI